MKIAMPPGARRAAALAPSLSALALAVAVALALASAVCMPAAGNAAPAEPAGAPPFPIDPPLARAPLARPLVFNAGFGDYRGGHFHAGFDFGTSRRVGRPVRAPEGGWVERVRTSGVGYGRSLYLRLMDGRILQFGHLDAFAAKLDAFVRQAQDSTGRYEQDLWLPRDRVRVKEGETIAWTGESGAGGPHLHFEVRRGDIAYNPLRAGLPSKDRQRPALLTLTLEPLDERSLAGGQPGPKSIALTGRDTLRAIGRLRAVVVARARSTSGTGGMAPWEVGVEWNGRRTECRFDSVSWATDMPEADYVYDAGRVTGAKGIVLWAPPGFRPRMLRSDAPAGEEAGTLEIRPGDPPRTLRIWAREVDGASVSRHVVLRPEPPPAEPSKGWWHAASTDTWDGDGVEFTSLPAGVLRVAVPGANAAKSLEIQVGDRARRAVRGGERWRAQFALPESAAVRTVRLPLASRSVNAGGTTETKGKLLWARRATPSRAIELSDGAGRLSVGVPAGALFEEATLLAFASSEAPAAPRGGARELSPVSQAWQIEPDRLPLRKAVTIRLAADEGKSLERVGLYRFESGRWQFVGADVDSTARSVRGESRQLGRFAIFRDDLAPRASLLPPLAPPATPGPYSRWAVEASVIETGSGVDARTSWLEVDGARVPTEWDPEAGRLRWRPVAPPAGGTHELLIVATDRAGNQARVPGRFRVGR
ncbi:MAG TPA: hypothetical protein VFS09_11915 [Candidatus Eisenbacteria bacterium]|nr:hypothetical protein [Candidatus Eisenbacteria bacterium]